MTVLSEIRALPEHIKNLAEGVHSVAGSLSALIDLQSRNGPAEARIEELERGRAKWEAGIEAALMKADSTLKSASNAESRSRTMLRHAEKLADPFAEEGDDVEDGVPPVNASVRNGETVPPVHEDLGLLSSKQLALRMKFS